MKQDELSKLFIFKFEQQQRELIPQFVVGSGNFALAELAEVA